MPEPHSVSPELTPRSASHPDGALYRDFILTVETRADAPDDDTRLQIAISSEMPVTRYDWRRDEEYVEVLDHSAKGPDLSYAKDGLPFCLDHSLRQQIGLLEEVRVDADGIIRGLLREGNHPDAAWVVADMRAGVRKKVSIGYSPGDTYTQTKGKTGQLPVRRYTGWRLFEASSVAVPADYSVGVGRSVSTEAGKPARTQEHRMPQDDTAAGAGSAPPATDDTPKRLAALARENETELPQIGQRLAAWIADGVSVDAARDEVMKLLRERNPAAPATSTGVQGVHHREEDKPWRDDGGDFIAAVIRAATNPHDTDVRLLAAKRTQNTNIGAEGGHAVPQNVNLMMLEASQAGSEILSRVTTRPITTGNGIKETVADETARTDGSRSAGLRHYWVAQEGEIPVSQAKTREIELAVKKVAVAVPVTEEQMEDGPALISFLKEQVPEEMRFGKELAIWSGTGVGSPFGVMNSESLITVAIEGSQTIANTAQYFWQNAAKMMVRMSPRSFLRSAWFIQQALWAKIVTATAGDPANGAVPLFTPPGRLDAAPFGAVYGRPLVPVEYASAEGTVGDILLADFKDYVLAQKGGTRYAESAHVEFLKDKRTLKWVERVDGQPRTRKPITPFKGASTVSPYVTLATRS